jgi:hypothetical protein
MLFTALMLFTAVCFMVGGIRRLAALLNAQVTALHSASFPLSKL